MWENVLPFLMFLALIGVLFTGYPVAFSVGGVAMAFAGIGILTGMFDPIFLEIYPSRIYGVMQNITLIAVPLFIFMGMILARSGVAERLLEMMGQLLQNVRGGMALGVILVGSLLAASTGIVGATVVTMTLIALPVMLKHGYSKDLASGVIASSGTLGQIVPPSIVLILLSDVLANPQVSVGKLFVAALVPSLFLILGYVAYVIWKGTKPPLVPPCQGENNLRIGDVVKILVPPLGLIILVLGSIFAGIATPTESAAVGVVGAMVIAYFFRDKSAGNFQQEISGAASETVKMTSMIFLILLAAQAFGLVFRGLGGDEIFVEFFQNFSDVRYLVLVGILLVIFFLGFFLDFVEITFIFVPILGPVLIDGLGFDPLWMAVVFAMVLQTSFLTPPLGFSLFYLKGAAKNLVETSDIYRGVIPFLGIQILVIVILLCFPGLVRVFL